MGLSGELYNFLESYLSGRLQRIVLNGQMSLWRSIQAGVPQGSILGPLLFLIYINNFPNELKSNVKLFANDTSLFTIVKDKNESANTLSNDLMLISKWAYNWKMILTQIPVNLPRSIIFKEKNKSKFLKFYYFQLNYFQS